MTLCVLKSFWVPYNNQKHLKLSNISNVKAQKCKFDLKVGQQAFEIVNWLLISVLSVTTEVYC